jgi:sterol desaturase/sphingolipid hydroxylase (fatty acid hydroxylase superfamily)
MLEQAWFLTFWGALAILAALEVLIPESQAPAQRSRRWPVNLGLAILNALLASPVPALTVLAAQWAAERHIGLLDRISAPAWAAFAITITVQSLAFYGLHLWSHANPVLWRLHRVHHGDPYLDATSSLRHHPLEMIASILILTPIYVICGLSPAAVAVYEMAEAMFGLLTHANLRLPERAERISRALFVTPAYHRVHHSDRQSGDRQQLRRRLFLLGSTIRNLSRRRHRFGKTDRVRAGGVRRGTGGRYLGSVEIAVARLNRRESETWRRLEFDAPPSRRQVFS